MECQSNVNRRKSTDNPTPINRQLNRSTPTQCQANMASTQRNLMSVKCQYNITFIRRYLCIDPKSINVDVRSNQRQSNANAKIQSQSNSIQRQSRIQANTNHNQVQMQPKQINTKSRFGAINSMPVEFNLFIGDQSIIQYPDIMVIDPVSTDACESLAILN